ncbi:MAG: ferrous iron transport protein B [Deltaproteobacteria bacterium]|nr:ferrous iron transport protein B [Deltaproteobacteria bacterium]
MTEHAQVPMIALAGNPNCGKTALFNAITGGRQRVANYPGVTVERKEGSARVHSGLVVNVLDLPGTYSLNARTPDEAITRDVLLGSASVARPEVVVAVADATNLERSLGLILELRGLGTPTVLALNMMDLARRRGLELDIDALERELGISVIPTVAVRKEGIRELLEAAAGMLAPGGAGASAARPAGTMDVRARFAEVDRILRAATKRRAAPTLWTDRIDRTLVHPFFGTVIMIAVLGLMFQAIFSWAAAPQDWIRAGIGYLSQGATAVLPSGPVQRLIVDGIIAGVGAVLVFLPQILLLFSFILLLEDSGYMARAAFLMDRLMGRVGLHGRAFIPLLSSFACAIPGIMATRTIENPRDRLTTILVAPLMTCSARLPVYALLIGAFIPNTVVWGPLRLQGLVMFGLYLAGILAALAMAALFRRTILSGPRPPLLMELPTYKWPSLTNVALGLVERARLFLRRAGTVILALSVLIWFLASYPKPPAMSAEPAIHFSYAGKIGRAIEPALRPLGFDWRVGVALIPGFAAREVMVGALATVYAVETTGEGREKSLGAVLARDWSVATALSLLVWYVFAFQCLSTLAVARRETNSWRWPGFMLFSMTALAYLGSLATYRAALFFGLG